MQDLSIKKAVTWPLRTTLKIDRTEHISIFWIISSHLGWVTSEGSFTLVDTILEDEIGTLSQIKGYSHHALVVYLRSISIQMWRYCMRDLSGQKLIMGFIHDYY